MTDNTQTADVDHDAPTTPPAEQHNGLKQPSPRETDDNPAAESEPKSCGTTARLRQFLGLIPTALILTALGGLGYWGHHTGWSMASFSEMTGQAAPEKDDWCAEHGVPESICVACNAELMPKPEPYGWCDKHGVHECPLCHPDVAQVDETPKVEERDLERAERALALRKRKENNPTCLKHMRRIQFVSQVAAEEAGIDIALVDRKEIVESIPSAGEITYDQTLVARLSTRAAGTVWRVYRNIGDEVRQGDVLAVVDASEVGRQKSDLLAAVTDYDLKKIQRDQLQRVAGDGIAERVFQEAEASLSAADIRVRKAVQGLVNLGFAVTVKQVLEADRKGLPDKLQFLGIPLSLAGNWDPETTTSNLIPVRAPTDGIVISRDSVAGEVVDTKKVLFTIADTSQMWLMLNVASEHAALLKRNQKVWFRPDGAEERIEGRISWISTKADPRTRTVKLRAELPNYDGSLRDETFGEGEVVLREDPGSIVVPNEAIHWEGCCHIAFVRDKDYMKDDSYKVFHTRVVRLGAQTPTHTEVLAGLLPWEVVVTKGGGVLRSELLKGDLGPG